MVSKLLKHEAIYYSRTLIISEIVLFTLALSCRFVMFFEYDHWLYYIIQASAFILFGLSAIALIYFTIAMCVIRFYKNLFTQEGYLTFALPVTTKQHILVKLFSAIVYNIIAFASIFVAFLITISGDILTEVIKSAAYLIIKLFEVIQFKDGINITFAVIYMLIIIFLSLINTLLLFYACIALGQTSRKNRILMAVVYYFLYGLITEIISTVISIFFNLLFMFGFEEIGAFIEKNPYLCMHIFFISLILFIVALNLIFYFVIYNIINKKLNLE